jgi:ADP-ribose pyrophosphatase YjhB (NUDIX family)
MTGIELVEAAKRLKAIADVGLLYCKNEYDQERYEEMKNISLQLLSGVSGQEAVQLKELFPTAVDYPTAKVDIRGFLLSTTQEVLLVREGADGKWSLPGGWADVGYTPTEIVVKEFREETGLDVTAERLLAVFDKRMHPHPPQPFYVYKMVFLCRATSTAITKGFDVLEVQYFPIDALPELSEDRILGSQIQLLYQLGRQTGAAVYVD